MTWYVTTPVAAVIDISRQFIDGGGHSVVGVRDRTNVPASLGEGQGGGNLSEGVKVADGDIDFITAAVLLQQGLLAEQPPGGGAVGGVCGALHGGVVGAGGAVAVRLSPLAQG